MFNIPLEQRDKQINYKVTLDLVINHNLLVELCFITWVEDVRELNSLTFLLELRSLNLSCFKNDNRWEIFHAGLRSSSKWLDHRGLLLVIASKYFVIEVVLGKPCWILVIYLTKFRKENYWIYCTFSFMHKF